MELDIEDFGALREYLRTRGDAPPPMQLRKLLGGVSNRTVLITWTDGPGWVMKQALAKLRVEADWFSNPERIRIEARALRWFNRLTPPGSTPRFVFEDPANHLMAMEAVPEGHENWKTRLLAGQVDLAHFEQFAQLLASIHRRSAECSAACLAFEDNSYFRTLRLEPYYLYTAQQVPEAAEFLRTLAGETLQHKLCLVHGDFSPKNTLLYDGRLILLDYEVVHAGDPAFDLGFALTHFLSKAHHLKEHRPQFAAGIARFWQTYREHVAVPRLEALERRAVRHSLACLLARVAGKSPLEYLAPVEAARQRATMLGLISWPLETVVELMDTFLERIEHAEN